MRDTDDFTFLEGCIRDAWAARNAIAARGFDSERRRRELAEEVDEYLEELFIHISVRDLDGIGLVP